MKSLSFYEGWLLYFICLLWLCALQTVLTELLTVCVSTGNVCLYARGEGNAIRDPRPGKSQTSYTLGAAGLRRAVHVI